MRPRHFARSCAVCSNDVYMAQCITFNNQSAKGTEMTDSIRNSSKKKKKKKKKKNLNLYKTFTRRTPNGIMDGLSGRVCQKG